MNIVSTTNATAPAIRFAVPLASENRWSDLLAVLIETDPAPFCDLLALDADQKVLSVQREATAGKTRPDLILHAAGKPLVVVEIKVLSGLGRMQLARYQDAIPDATHYVTVFPERLIVDTAHTPKWRPVTWEALLREYQQSQNRWVSQTAAAWLRHLDSALPKVDGTTIWNDVPDGQDFVHAMRTRISWLFSDLQPPPPVRTDLVESSAGVSAVVRMYTDASVEGYLALAEIEERLDVRDYPKLAHAGRPPLGPSAWIGLQQVGVDTSAGFDWDYLHSVWRQAMSVARIDWLTNSPRPKGIDKDNYQALVASGAPRYLGVGFGGRQTRLTRACMFGARVRFPAEITLESLRSELDVLCELVVAMSGVTP